MDITAEIQDGCVLDSAWYQVNPKINMSPISLLFSRLTAMYPAKWARQFGSPEEVDAWKFATVEELLRLSITPQEVREGLSRCLRLHPEWPPALGELIACFRPPLNPEMAFHEAIAGMLARERQQDFAWSHPAIFWAAYTIGFELRVLPYAQIKERWTETLRKTHELGAWEPIPVPEKQIGWVAKVSELGAAAAESVRNAQIEIPSGTGWARKIIQRKQAGEKVAFYALREAEKVLGLNGAK